MLLLVDNDWLALRPWIQRLRDAGYMVEPRNHADRAVAGIKDLRGLQGAIIDVMMPAPAAWGPKTMAGMATGLVIAQKLRETCPKLPIVFLTSQRDAAVLQKLEAFESPSLYLDKRELTTDSFVAKVQELVGEPKDSAPPESAKQE